jgi:hypothetical protein
MTYSASTLDRQLMAPTKNPETIIINKIHTFLLTLLWPDLNWSYGTAQTQTSITTSSIEAFLLPSPSPSPYSGFLHLLISSSVVFLWFFCFPFTTALGVHYRGSVQPTSRYSANHAITTPYIDRSFVLGLPWPQPY